MTADIVCRLYVGTCGPGRMRFRAWFPDETMDRQDGDDMGTFGSPAAAIRVAATRLEAMIWNTNGLPPTEPKETDKDIQEIVVRRIEEHRFSSGYFGAAFRTGTIGRGVGDTPSISLRALATLLEINAVKYYWYAAFLGHK